MTQTTDPEPQTTPTAGAHYVWDVIAELKSPDETLNLGQIELEGETYGDKTDQDGLRLFVEEREHIGSEYLFRGQMIPVVRVKRFSVQLVAATNRAAALESEPSEG